MIISIDWPPSVNHYWERGKNGRMFIGKRGIAFRKSVKLAVMQIIGNSEPLTCHLSCRIMAYPPDKRRRDIDNILKATLDALEKSGVYKDDSQIKDLRIIMNEPVRSGRLEIAIKEIEKC